MSRLTLLILAAILSGGWTLPVDYGYDNYVNVNLDNSNANSYFMDNKPGFDYSQTVNYQPFSNYFGGGGSYRQEPMTPVKPQFMYPFHTIFVITTAHGQTANGGSGLLDHHQQHQGYAVDDQPEPQSQQQPIFHPGQSVNVDFSSSPAMDQVLPILLKNVFTHSQGSNGPMSTVQMSQGDEDYPKFEHQPQSDENEGHRVQQQQQPEMVDYPVVITIPEQHDQIESFHVMEDKKDEEPQVMTSTEKMSASTVVSSSEEQKVSPNLAVDSMEIGGDAPKWIPRPEVGGADNKGSDESPPIHPREEETVLTVGEEKKKVEAPVTFETIDADDEIFMTTESVPQLGDGEKVTEMPMIN